MSTYGLEIIEREIRNTLFNELNRVGFLFRLFSRVKEKSSIEEKLTRKSYGTEKKMQDIIGFRITTYFQDDITLIVDICKKLFEVIELVYDEPEAEVFKPLRKNMICKLPSQMLATFNELTRSAPNEFNVIDSTFEIQFRTTLSEGWHEVDHSLRYKCKQDWNNLQSESRMLNGIYATLETNDQALIALFEDISFNHYKNRNWEAMIRNKFRIRFILKELNPQIVDFFNSNNEVGRAYYKLNRNTVIKAFQDSNIIVPISFDLIIFFINHRFLKNENLTRITPSVLLSEFETSPN